MVQTDGLHSLLRITSRVRMVTKGLTLVDKWVVVDSKAGAKRILTSNQPEWMPDMWPGREMRVVGSVEIDDYGIEVLKVDPMYVRIIEPTDQIR